MARRFTAAANNFLRVVNPINALDLTGNLMTVSFKVKALAWPGTFGFLVCRDQVGAGGTRAWTISLQPNANLRFDIFDTGGGVDVITTPNNSLVLSTWAHVACVKNGSGGSSMLAYVNGVQSQIGGGTRTILDTTSDFTVGSRGTGDLVANAEMEDVAIWKAALPVAQILALARGVSPLRVRPGLDLVGFWPLWGLAYPEPDLTYVRNGMVQVGAVAAGAAGLPRNPTGPYV